MVLWQQGARYASHRMPKLIGPTTHAAFDYAFAGSLLVIGVEPFDLDAVAGVPGEEGHAFVSCQHHRQRGDYL